MCVCVCVCERTGTTFEQKRLPTKWNVAALGFPPLSGNVILHSDLVNFSPDALKDIGRFKQIHVTPENRPLVTDHWRFIDLTVNCPSFTDWEYFYNICPFLYFCRLTLFFLLCAVSLVLNHCQVYRIAAVVYQCYSDVNGPDSVSMETFKPALAKLGKSIQVRH